MIGRFVLGALLLLGGTGCISNIQYQPNLALLEEIGREQGITLLSEIMTRARNPRILDVEVAPDFFIYTFQGPLQMSWVVVGHHPSRIKIHFNNLERVDIYANDRTLMIDPGGRELAHIDFGSQEDACRFSDLVLGLKAQQKNWPGPANPAPEEWPELPPPAPAEEPVEAPAEAPAREAQNILSEEE